ncbi:hypothetical protein KI387_010235, partial [Taxus chinensis]
MANIPKIEDVCSLEVTAIPDSKSQTSGEHGSNSWRGCGSISLSRDSEAMVVEEIDESEITAISGDDGGRISFRGSSRREIDVNKFDLGLKLPTDALIYSYPLGDPTQITTSPVSPLPSDIISPPLSDHPLLIPREGGGVDDFVRHQDPKQQVNQQNHPRIMEYMLILSHLGVFGILGIFIRYALQIIFGPDVANVTNDHSALYIDLPSNMVGSFFMGWVGVVFKRKISLFSEALAIGLSTGLMGSITTFTSWIQKMVNLTTEGHWLSGIIGFLIGMELSQMSLALGIESAKLIAYVHGEVKKKQPRLKWAPTCEYYQHSLYGFIICMFIIGILWGGSIVLSVFEFRSHHKKTLWIACMVGPFGVWIRWYLARLNGQGIGAKKTPEMVTTGNIDYKSNGHHHYGNFINNSYS